MLEEFACAPCLLSRCNFSVSFPTLFHTHTNSISAPPPVLSHYGTQRLTPGSLRAEEMEFLDSLQSFLSSLQAEPLANDNKELVNEFLGVVHACATTLAVAQYKADSLVQSALAMALAQPNPNVQGEIFFDVPKNIQTLHTTLLTVTTQRERPPESSLSTTPRSCIDSFVLPILDANDTACMQECAPGMVSVASDGNHIYVHTPTFIVKVGTGYGGTRPGGLIRHARLEAVRRVAHIEVIVILPHHQL